MPHNQHTTPPTMTQDPLPRERSLADHAYEQILAMIMEGEFAVGSKLPTEHELSRELGISRPVLRSALKSLREDSVIISRQGSGSFVNRRPEGGLMDFAPIGSISDIQSTFEFRTAIEGEAAYLAAERRSEAQLKRMHDIQAEWDKSNSDGNLGVSADEDFHTLICTASKNQYFMSARVSMRTNILAGMNLTLNLTRIEPETRMRMVREEHSAILTAIAAKDPDGSKQAMRDHIEAARRRVFEGE